MRTSCCMRRRGCAVCRRLTYRSPTQTYRHARTHDPSVLCTSAVAGALRAWSAAALAIALSETRLSDAAHSDLLSAAEDTIAQTTQDAARIERCRAFSTKLVRPRLATSPSLIT